MTATHEYSRANLCDFLLQQLRGHKDKKVAVIGVKVPVLDSVTDDILSFIDNPDMKGKTVLLLCRDRSRFNDYGFRYPITTDAMFIIDEVTSPTHRYVTLLGGEKKVPRTQYDVVLIDGWSLDDVRLFQPYLDAVLPHDTVTTGGVHLAAPMIINTTDAVFGNVVAAHTRSKMAARDGQKKTTVVRLERYTVTETSVDASRLFITDKTDALGHSLSQKMLESNKRTLARQRGKGACRIAEADLALSEDAQQVAKKITQASSEVSSQPRTFWQRVFDWSVNK